MTADNRNWRESKIPSWVKTAVEQELAAANIRAALAWPTEARPKALPFGWGAYDNPYGEAEEGVVHSITYDRVTRIEIARNNGECPPSHKTWKFSCDGGPWTSRLPRGPLFRTEREARLALLWNACDKSAIELAGLRKPLDLR